MKYAALDTETTGLDHDGDQVLQIAIVIEDTKTATEYAVQDLPTFEALIWHERLSGDPVALHMNREIIEVLAGVQWGEGSAKGYPQSVHFRGRNMSVYSSLDLACNDAIRFLRREYDVGEAQRLSSVVAAGKNVAMFDMPFLAKANGGQFKRVFGYRVLDVGNVALGGNPARWEEAKPPGMRDLLDEDPSHDALGDARDVVTLLRRHGGYLQLIES